MGQNVLVVNLVLTIHLVLQPWHHHHLILPIVELVSRMLLPRAGSLADQIRIAVLGRRAIAVQQHAPHQIFKAVPTSFVVQISVMQVSDATSLVQVVSTGNATSVKAVMVSVTYF
jgi:hypothetical protein